MVDDPKQGGEEQHHGPEKIKGPFALREEAVLKFWDTEGIFEKSLQKVSPKGEYVFYDGPPFANGLPHYGHILASTIKDAIPRYCTMQGYHVARRWGWDCHGLPVENLVEKELGFKTKRDIEAFGIEKFNEAARVSIMKDVADWKRIIPRLGRWVDMDNDYKTMDSTYTESVWWAFKNLYDKKLIYEGFKAMHLCPRCGTTLSNFEVAEGYKDIDDISVTVRLPLTDDPSTSLLVWTTTPWTLPGNAAAAVNPDATYWKVKEGEEYIIASEAYFLNKSPDVLPVQKYKGKELVGRKYVPPFEYFTAELHKHKTHAWKVYTGAFVTMDSGTGIVHLAPAFGADDLALAQKEKIPVIHHVTEEGKFIATVHDFAGLSVKPKGNPRETDEKIVAHLMEQGALYAQEKIHHSYPHCWRCETPLLNWAAHSWFVKVSAIKTKLQKENARMNWTPKHIGEGRFHNGLGSAPDWAISRSRYWGAPLPVWRNTKTKEIKVAGSVDEVLALVRRSGNRYFAMRHGECQSNVHNTLDSHHDPDNHLTESGSAGVQQAAESLRKEHIDLIITSPFLRTRETAAIVQKELGLPDSAVMVDERLQETQLGIYSGGTRDAWHASYTSLAERFAKGPEGGESFTDIRRRVGEFLFEIERRYAGKNILIVSHGNPLWLMGAVAARTDSRQLLREVIDANADPRELPFVQYPHNTDYELDLHRPYIDDLPMGNTITGEWKRIPDVFDCWFESGSMPFASGHYPFDLAQGKPSAFNPKRFFGFGSRGYPAHFIAEGLDQTRGWFYSLIVLGTALFGKSPYKNVIVNGLILAGDGQKMSKRLRNYPDPMEVVEKYGADALRYYLLSSAVVRAEDLRFQEKGVDEIQKKLLMRLDNVRSFYDLYVSVKNPVGEKVLGFPRPEHLIQDAPARPDYFPQQGSSRNVLDRWILARLGELVRDTTAGFESYELDAATRPLMAFVDDLSTWYVRRSRDRCKDGGEEQLDVLSTLRIVFNTVSRVMAPVMPFFAEDLYRRVRAPEDPESVHLCGWPEPLLIDEELLLDMQEVRLVASQGLEARERAGIKIRQPLATLSAKKVPTDAALRAIIAEEVNVKEVVEDTAQHADVVLDTNITPELKEEGMFREWVRSIQGWRKDQNFSITDRPAVRIVSKDADFLNHHAEALISATGLQSLEVVVGEETLFEKL